MYNEFLSLFSQEIQKCISWAKPDKNKKIMQSLREGIVNFIACISYRIMVQLNSYQV